jgi:hypothetical protein
MVKKPTFGGWKMPKPRKARNPSKISQPAERPAMRNLQYEQLLATAMDDRRLVELRYEGDAAPRLFQPEGIYHSSRDKVCVAGVQVRNPNHPGKDDTPHVFEVGRVMSLRVSETAFLHPVRFDRYDDKYAEGVIHSAEPR